jgi:hypothetical protein
VTETELELAPNMCRGLAWPLKILRILEPAAVKLLKPPMRTIAVEHGDVLHSSSSDMEFAYFPRSAIISVLARTKQSRPPRLVANPWNYDFGQVGGEAVRIPTSEVHRIGKTSEGFPSLCSICHCSRNRNNRRPVRPSRSGKSRRTMVAPVQKTFWNQRHQTNTRVLRPKCLVSSGPL